LIDATSGNMAFGNVIQASGGNGIEVDAADGNTIGGTTEAARNTIGSNGGDGILISDQSKQELIQANDVSQNGTNGIEISDSVMNTIGGMVAGARNDIYSNKTGNGISLNVDSNKNLIIGNFIGTGASGETKSLYNYTGITIDSSVSNTIGGTAAGASNLISDNIFVNVLILDEANSNVVLGNLIGPDISGKSALANIIGISINSAFMNTIGGTAAGARNVISGNITGLQIVNYGGGNVIEGNLIGTDISGLSPLANNFGISITTGDSNTIGGTASGARNIISGNFTGIQILDVSVENVVDGNFIGTDITGESPLGNTGFGIFMDYAFDNYIGSSGAGNVISGNLWGIEMTDIATGNVVEGNLIGTDASGESSMPNKNYGIWLDNAFGTTIGGTASGDRNIISGNATGVVMDASSALNVVLGNFIGSNLAGESSIGNDVGISILGANDNTVGGTAAGAANVISGNTSIGVSIANSSATGNQVLGNYIGTNKEGTGLVPPAASQNTGLPLGVYIDDAPDNAIGGLTAIAGTGAGNLISGFGVAIDITGTNASGNSVQGNLIGTDRNRSILSQSVGYGVYIDGAALNTVGGTSGAGNVILGYESYGVYINGTLATGNVVQGDQIGALATSQPRAVRKAKRAFEQVQNVQLAGIAIQDASSNIIGGSIAGGNIVSGNSQAGVYIFGHQNSASNNVIKGNRFNKNLYGILLYNAPNNGGGSITLRNINRFVRNNIADVREFTGAVPATSSAAAGASTSIRALGAGVSKTRPQPPSHVIVRELDKLFLRGH
jgi:large repetitive protein